MDLKDLEVFIAVAEEGSVTRAADRVGRVQSAVTQRIQGLEDDLGAPLFIRDRTGMRLSAQGEVLMAYAGDLLSMARETKAAVADQRPRGILRLGSMESTAAVRLPPVLVNMSEMYPELRVELTVGNPQTLGQALARGEVEAALFAPTVDMSRFSSEVAFVEDLVLVSAKGQPEPHSALPMRILVFEHGCPHRLLLDQYLESIGSNAAEIVQLASYQAILGCAAAGMGHALVPESTLGSYPNLECLSLNRLPSPFDKVETLVAWPKGPVSPKVAAFLELLREHRPPLVS